MTSSSNDSVREVNLSKHLGIELVEVEAGRALLKLKIEPHHFAINGYLHAGTVISLADTAAGFGCIESLPEGASSFTTIELKSNLMGTAREGEIICEAQAVHMGKMTQVWEAVVKPADSDKIIAKFTCTQMVLYPRSG